MSAFLDFPLWASSPQFPTIQSGPTRQGGNQKLKVAFLHFHLVPVPSFFFFFLGSAGTPRSGTAPPRGAAGFGIQDRGEGA